MGFFVLPIFDGVIMDGHPIFWVVDAGVSILDLLGFICQKYQYIVHWLHLNNYTPYENKCFNPRYQNHGVVFRHARKISNAYRCVTRYAVFTRVKYATILRNCWTCYPSLTSNGWAEFRPEAKKFLVDMLNHAHWLRIKYKHHLFYHFMRCWCLCSLVLLILFTR